MNTVIDEEKELLQKKLNFERMLNAQYLAKIARLETDVRALRLGMKV